jgi:DNA polymerase III subunit delta'
MLFDNIQGQESAIATLRHTLASDRLGHAYLFTGPAGVGKKRTALALAQTLLCEDKPRASCGVCAGCVSVAAGTHPDLIVVAPVPGKRDVIIDQVRELQRLFGLRPVRGGKKVAVLDDAHLLNPAAQSALLKILEEPPGDALLLLLTVNSATLSRPLLSRCQQVRFTTLPLPVVEDLLVREHGKDPATARALALYSRGSIGRAVALDPQVFTEERQYAVKEFQQLRGAPFTTLTRLAAWLVADRAKKSLASDQPSEGRTTGERLEIMLSWYEEVLRYVLLGQDGVVRYQDCVSAVAEAAAGLDVPVALRQLSLVYDTIQALGRNANRQLAVEDLLIQLSLPRSPEARG